MRNRPSATTGPAAATADRGRNESERAIENGYAKWLDEMRVEDKRFFANLREMTGHTDALINSKEIAGRSAEEETKGLSANKYALHSLKMMRAQLAGRDEALADAIKYVEGAATPQQVAGRMAEETKVAEGYLGGEKARAVKVHGDKNSWGSIVKAAENGTLEFSKGMPVSER